MTLEEKEQQLIQEINFFNHNIEWWSNEFAKVNIELERAQNEDSLGINQRKIDKLMAKMTYLAGKVKVEQKTAEEIDKKLYKLNLAQELAEIQDDFSQSKKKLRKR